MKLTNSILILALLFVVGLDSVEAGKLKGLKGAVEVNTERNLKKKGKKHKKTKRRGPQSRSCISSASPDQVEFQCRSRSLADDEPHHHSHSHSDSSDSKDAKEVVAAEETESSVLRTVVDDEDKTRGVTITYIDGETKVPAVNSTDSASELIKDEIKYVVKTSQQGIEVTIEYKQEVATDSLNNKTATEFVLHFDTLVEYVKGAPVQDMGANYTVDSDAFDWTTDKIIQTIPLENWRDIPGIISEKDSVISYFTATADLSEPGVAVGPTGTTQFNFTVSEADVGEHTTANTMKIDVRILDFPWQRTDSYIALMSSVNSKKSVQMQYNDEATVDGEQVVLTEDVFVAFEEELQQWGLEAFGEYTWETDAEVTSDNLNVAGASYGRALVFDNDEEAFQNGNSPNKEPAKEDIVTAEAEVASESTPSETSEETHATVATTKIQVVATSPDSSDANYQKIAYSFVGSSAHAAKEIYWDPEAGVGYYDKEEAIGFEEGYDGEDFDAESESAAWSWSRSVSAVTTLACAVLYMMM